MVRIRSKSLAILVATALVVAMFAMGAPAAAANGCPMSDPVAYPLYAAQDMLVGHVYVSNCTEHVHVEYMMMDGWTLLETHVQLSTELCDIPQTKKGNPIPGQFEDTMCFAEPGVTTYSYMKSLAELGIGVDDPVHVAAHAKVAKVIDGCWCPVWQIGDVEMTDPATGLLYNYADEFNWGYPADPITMGPSLAVEEPAFDDPFIVGTSLTSAFPYNSNYVRHYADDFDVQWAGSLPWGGKLTFSWSPGSSALERKELSLAGDGISPTVFTATGSSVAGMGWFMDKYPLVENVAMIDPLAMGDHTLNFKQLAGDGTFWDWVRLEKPCIRHESAWAATEVGEIQFPGANWATYVMYTVQPILVDTVEVPSNGSAVESIALTDGMDYLLKASGTYRFANWATTEYPELGYADAKFSLRPPGMPYSYHTELVPTWVSGDDIPAPYTNYLEVKLDSAAVAWGAFSSAHEYEAGVVGGGSALSFQILDTSYGDNSGFITVEIWALP